MIKSEVRTITPEMAFDLLTKNTKNYRRVDPRTVARYADAMRADRWEMNGEPITFSKSGVLLNGQHRLTAIVESGKTVRMLVVTGLDDNVAIYDDGKTRSAMDVAANLGVNVDTRMIAAANVMLLPEFAVAWRPRVDKRTAVEYAADHEKDLRLAKSCVMSGTSGARLMDRAWATAAAYMLIRDGKNPSVISDFCQVANSGLPIAGKECSSALVFRNMFFMQSALTRRSDAPDNMHYMILAVGDFASGIRRVKTYAMQTIAVNRAEELWHKIRRLDGIE